jgi:hypothetical protein
MSISAQGGVVSFAEQPAKIGVDGTFDHTTLDWYKVRAPRISLGTVQDQQTFPLEVGGTLTPTGSFKQGYFFAGELDLIPRLEQAFGFLVKATLGVASTVTGKDADGNVVVGVNTHIFRFDPAAPSAQPWMAVRRVVPGASAGQKLGELGFDCKIQSLDFTVPAKGKVAASMSMMGRDVNYDDASTWVYENEFEDSTSSPDAGRGQFKIGGVQYPIIGAQLSISNGLSTPDQEMVIGDFRPDDFIALTRGATIRIVYKYENPDLYKKILTGAANGTEWSSLPFIVNTAGAVFAFDARFQSPALIGATNVPYEMRIRANRVTWAVDRPIELQAGGIITQTFTGTILEPAEGEDYIQILIVNDQASYN